MKKHKENLFSSKFRLFSSQELSEEISWSSSESSEFEEINNKPNFNNITNKKPNRKRKRRNKVPNNLSNLDITVIDVNKDCYGEKSPVLTVKAKSKSYERPHNTTYSLDVSPEYKNNRTTTSPVLCKGQSRPILSIMSPVIAQKFASPVNSPKVRKTLFTDTSNNLPARNRPRNVSPVLSGHFELDRRRIEENFENLFEPSQQKQDTVANQEVIRVEKTNATSKRVNVDLIKKVKSFFDSHFNSENSSQHSIADTLTPKNSSSDDIEILSAITQMNSNESIKSIKHTNSTDNSVIEAEKSKKMKYKKDGLAYRLNALLKKHNANISIWQHERFLVENSNFKIPKGEHLVFRIQKVTFKFGCFLLQAMDGNDGVFLILINNSYVNNSVFIVDSVFKLYEPYQIFEFDDKKLIVNVCKFECLPIVAL